MGLSWPSRLLMVGPSGKVFIVRKLSAAAAQSPMTKRGQNTNRDGAVTDRRTASHRPHPGLGAAAVAQKRELQITSVQTYLQPFF